MLYLSYLTDCCPKKKVAPKKAAACTVSIPSARCLTKLPPVVGVAVSSCGSGLVTPMPTPSLKPTIKLPSVQLGHRPAGPPKTVSFTWDVPPTPATSASSLSSRLSYLPPVTGTALHPRPQSERDTGVSSQHHSLPPVRPPGVRRAGPRGSTRSCVPVISARVFKGSPKFLPSG